RTRSRKEGITSMRLSYSKLKTFEGCALKYRLAYIERLPRPPIRSLAFQRRIHSALASYHLYAKRDGTVHLDQLLDKYDEVIGANEDSGVRDTPAYQEGREILRLYYEREQQTGRVPAYLEHTINVELGPYILTGKVDRLDFTDDGGYSLVDYKLDR